MSWSISDWMMTELEKELIAGGRKSTFNNLIADRWKGIGGLVLTGEEQEELIYDHGPELMTETELYWLWDQLRGYEFESDLIKDLVTKELAEKVQEWARMIEARREGGERLTFNEFNPDAMSAEQLRKFGKATTKRKGRAARVRAFFLGQERQDYVKVYQSLGNYASIKARAIWHREKGRIQRALALEAELDKIYENLPEWARW